MGNIKQDVKESVKVFILTFVSYVVKESTKKLIKSLTQIQRKMLESKVKNMSDEQLEQYFDKDPYFKKELENTVKSANHIQQAQEGGSWLENLQMVCESPCIRNLINALIQQVTRTVLAVVAGTALLAVIAAPFVIDDLHKNTEFPNESNSNETIIPPTFWEEVIPTLAEEPVLPFSNFSTSVISGYAPLSVQFTDLSENATGRKWNFGDGNSSEDKDPAHIYFVPGNYTVNLTVSNINGTDSKLSVITVFEEPILPVANFSSNVTSGYAPLSVQFIDSSENATEWRWGFGDLTSSPEQNPAHSYSFAGNYTINLTAVNTNGTDSAFAVIKVLKRPEPVQEPVPPVANFNTNVTRGYVPLSVHFTDLSEHATEWKWDFGDESTSTGQHPVHTYYAAGNYTVNLTLSNSNDTDSKLATINVLKATPEIIWNKPADMIYGIVLNSTQLNASATIPGTFVYNPESGTMLSAGMQTLHADFAPDDTTNFTTASKDVTLNVLNATYAYITNQYSNDVYVIDATKKVIATIPVGNYPVEVVASQDGTKAYVINNGDSTVSIIDTATNNVTDTVNVVPDPTEIAVSPDGLRAYVINDIDDFEGNLSIINTLDNTIYTVDVGSHPDGIAVSPHGSKVYVSGRWDSIVSVIDTATYNVTDTMDIEIRPFETDISPDGAKIYVVNTNDNAVTVIDTDTNNVINTMNVGFYPTEVTFSSDGTKAYVINHGDSTVSIIDTATNNITDTIPVGGFLEEVAVSPDGSKVYVINYGMDSNENLINCTVSVVDTATNNVTAVSVGKGFGVIAVAPDGLNVYVANGLDDTVSIIDTATNTITATVPVGNGPNGVAIIQK